MAYLVETSILVRLANTADANHTVAAQAVLRLHRRGESLRTTPQNFVEFRNCATRPISANGLGLAPAVVEAQTTAFETTFPLLPETPDIYPAWKALVQASGVIGKQVHDARLVAVCHVYGITHVLTFNVQHFVRFAAFGPGIAVVDPSSI
jgi:predicted nucleic acid-binding protein